MPNPTQPPTSPSSPPAPDRLPVRSAALRASRALLVEIAAVQPAGPDRAQLRLQIADVLRGKVAGRDATLVVPTWPAVPAPLQRPVSPWQQVSLRTGGRLLALAETGETAPERVLSHPALRSLWPADAAEDVRALLSAEREGTGDLSGAALRVVEARRARGGPLLGEWLLLHLVAPLAAPGPLLDDVRRLLAAPDTSPALREALARALYEAALLSWESDPGRAHALAQALLEGTLRREMPEPLQRRLLAGEVRAVLTETRPAPSAVALLPDAGARARLQTAVAALGPSAGGALATWIA